ncbi:MAG: hypothetical protein WA280_00860, partial [Xanthobacteraceae bacterium]
MSDSEAGALKARSACAAVSRGRCCAFAAYPSLRAKRSNPGGGEGLDCFVALLLAMTSLDAGLFLLLRFEPRAA